MKTPLKSLLSLAAALTFGAAALSAQSSAAVEHSAQAGSHAAAASGESVAGSASAVGGIVAVPLWMSGAVVESGGTALSAVGDASVQAGQSTEKGATRLWDFSNGDPAQRPALDRHCGVPPAPPSPAPAKRAKDASPAETLNPKTKA